MYRNIIGILIVSLLVFGNSNKWVYVLRMGDIKGESEKREKQVLYSELI